MEVEFQIWLVMAALVGACFGSFISLISYRLPLEEPVIATRSRCPRCTTPLGPLDLFPIFSYLLSKGRCRHCKTKISARYPLTEIITATSFVLLLLHYGPGALFIIMALLAVCIITLIITDLEHYIIPDEIQIAIGLLGIAYCFLQEHPLEGMLLGALAGLAIGLALRYGFLWIMKKDGLGMGDVKLLAVVGIWLGVEPMIPYLFYSGILGIVSALLWRVLGLGERFPFGPALALAFLLCVIYPQAPQYFWNWPSHLLVIDLPHYPSGKLSQNA